MCGGASSVTDSNPPENMSAYEFDVCKLGVSSHHTECWSSHSVAQPLTWKRRSRCWGDTQQSLCAAFASFVVMAHQRDITSVDADTVDSIKDVSIVCVCVCVHSMTISDRHVECSLCFIQFNCPSFCLLEASHALYKCEPGKPPRKCHWQ